MIRLRALDLFCCHGGASDGLFRAGFDVLGVDIEEQPGYPHEFFQTDATSLSPAYLRTFDFVWASPPCQNDTAYKRRPGHVRAVPQLIPQTRELLRAAGVPYIIENVPGAPLENPITLCGSMFGLDVQRHRLFEASFPLATVLRELGARFVAPGKRGVQMSWSHGGGGAGRGAECGRRRPLPAEKVNDKISKWFKYGEYLTVEIDTDADTCVVVAGR